LSVGCVNIVVELGQKSKELGPNLGGQNHNWNQDKAQKGVEYEQPKAP